MRPWHILAVLTFFIAPLEGHAQLQTSIDSLDEACSVPGDPRWTPQETFVWEQACVGKVADFNVASGYGGKLDPKKPEGWPQSRVLRPAFLEMILLKEPYRRALTRVGVAIVGARFTDAIDLAGAELLHPFGLWEGILEKGGNFSRMKSKFLLAITESKVAGTLVLSQLDLDADLLIYGGEFARVIMSDAHVGGGVLMFNSQVTNLTLSDAHIGRLNLNSTKVTGQLNMDQLRVDQLLSMAGGEFADVGLAGAHVAALNVARSKVRGDLALVKATVDGDVSLIGSKVSGKLNMNGVRVGHSLLMRGAAEFSDVELTAAHVGGSVDLNSSKVTGQLGMDSLRVDQLLLMSSGDFTDVVLADAQVGTVLNLAGSKVTGTLNMNGAHASSVLLTGSKTGHLFMNRLRVDQSLSMSSGEFTDVGLSGAHIAVLNLAGSKVSGDLGLVKATVDGDANFVGLRVSGKLNMNGVRVDHSLLMRGGAEFSDLELTAAYVGGSIELEGSKVSRKFNMNAARVDQLLLMRGAEFADVDLTGAHVGGSLELSGSKVKGQLRMRGLRVDQLLLMDNKAELADVILNGAHVGGELSFRGSKIEGNINCNGLSAETSVSINGAAFYGSITCRGAKIKGSLRLNGEFKNAVDLTAAEIGGELFLGGVRWSDSSALILRNASVGVIPSLADAWAPKLELSGFTYRSANAADKFEDWFGKVDSYAPQPYDQLASVVQRQGDAALATAIRYSGRERELAEAAGLKRAWLTILKLVIGYGYYPQLAIFWAIVLVIAGAIVLRVSGEGPSNGMPIGLAYSFDTLLPIVRLRDRHYQIDLQTWARYYFYCHKIMGYVLASFLIAGISGLTK